MMYRKIKYFCYWTNHRQKQIHTYIYLRFDFLHFLPRPCIHIQDLLAVIYAWRIVNKITFGRKPSKFNFVGDCTSDQIVLLLTFMSSQICSRHDGVDQGSSLLNGRKHFFFFLIYICSLLFKIINTEVQLLQAETGHLLSSFYFLYCNHSLSALRLEWGLINSCDFIMTLWAFLNL